MERREYNQNATPERCLLHDATLCGDAQIFGEIYHMNGMFSMHDYFVEIGEGIEIGI